MIKKFEPVQDIISPYAQKKINEDFSYLYKVIENRGIEILSDAAFLNWLDENGVKHQGEWDDTKEYVRQSVVIHEGNSYTSKKRVPVGTDILNEDFWVVTGNYNAQVEIYRDEVVRSNQRLEKTIEVANVKHFGAVGDFNPENLTGTNDYNAFKNASDYAKENNIPIEVPGGNYKVDGNLEIFDSIKGEGTIFLPNANKSHIKISSKNAPIEIDVSKVSGLNENSNRIIGLDSSLINHTLVIRSNETLIQRYNLPNNVPYTKNEVAIITSDNGDIVPTLDNNYDKSKIHSMYAMPKENKMIFSLNIKGYGEIEKNGELIINTRSNVLFDRMATTSLNGYDIKTHISYSDCALIEFNGVSMTIGNYDGFGYGISIGNSCFSVLNNCHINDFRHAVTGRHGKAVTIKGGSYSDDIDSHWGTDYIIENVYLKGAIKYCGKNIIFKNSKVTAYNDLILVRNDTPELKGHVMVDNIDVTYSGDYGNLFYHTASTDFTWRKLSRPDNIDFKNININNDIPVYLLQEGPGFFSNVNDPFKQASFENIKSISNIFYSVVIKNSENHTNVNYNPIINIKNINFSDTSFITVRSLDMDNFNTDWGYKLNIEKCKDVNINIDSDAFKHSIIEHSSIKSIDRVNGKGIFDVEIEIIDCLMSDALLSGEFYYIIKNSTFSGVISAYSQAGFRNSLVDRVKIAKGNSRLIGTIGISSFDVNNYVNPDFYMDTSI